MRPAGWALVALLLVPGAARSQTCGVPEGAALGVHGGYARYELAGGTAGPAAGVQASWAAGGVGVRVAGQRIFLDGEDPDLVTAQVAVPLLPLPLLPAIRLCGVAHAGGSRTPTAGEAALSLAGGVGARLAAAIPVELAPTAWVEVRGLGARTTGSPLGRDVDVTGLSIGVAAGLQGELGPLLYRVAGSWDGFDDGLGPVPYPTQTVELGLSLAL